MGEQTRTKPPIPRLAFSPDEAAEALGLTPRAVYNLIARGELRASRIGRRSTRIKVTEIERLLAAGEVSP